MYVNISKLTHNIRPHVLPVLHYFLYKLEKTYIEIFTNVYSASHHEKGALVPAHIHGRVV
jgi:hypothetical protein